MRAILAVLVLTASGCVCWSQQEACVEARTGTCFESNVTECIDLTADSGDEEDGSAQQGSGPDCGGTWELGSCASQGFEKRCDGYFVRPGSAC